MDIPLSAEPILHIGSFTVTNTLIMSWLISATLIVFALLATRRVAFVPQKLQNASELVIETFYNLTASIAPQHARTFFPIIMTLFIFILVSNWFGLLPGISAIGLLEQHNGESVIVPFLRSASSDINTTLGLALLTVLLTQYFGLRFKGLRGYVSHYFHNPLHGGILFVLLGLTIGSFVGLLELVSEFVKVVSLSFRLFGNIYAGEVVVNTISGLISYIAPVPFLLLETIVGVVQATVFALLTLVFFSIISENPTEEHH